jgi:hypothetical protein
MRKTVGKHCANLDDQATGLLIENKRGSRAATHRVLRYGASFAIRSMTSQSGSPIRTDAATAHHPAIEGTT